VRVPVLGCLAEDFSNILPAPNLPPIFNTTSAFLKLGQSSDVKNEHIASSQKGHNGAQQATIDSCSQLITSLIAKIGSFLPFQHSIRCWLPNVF
jgi:hypothetical protein